MTQTRKRSRGQSEAVHCCPDLEALLPADLFRALCDPSRIAILADLARSHGTRSVTDISECCPIDISVVSRHLATLRDAGVLQAHREGKRVCYSVRGSEMAQTLRAMADALEACCPAPQEVSTGGNVQGRDRPRSTAQRPVPPPRSKTARRRSQE